MNQRWRRIATGWWLVLVLCVGAGSSEARGRETGLPLMQVFTPRELTAEPQNWAVLQAPSGLIYAGNSNGQVLEFDGSHWRGIPIANRTVVRSLAIGEAGRIYVGALGELGYLSPDHQGALRYHSLREHIPAAARDFADVWRTLAQPDGIYFSSYQHVLHWRQERMQVLRPATPGAFHKLISARGRLFISERGRGLLELLDGEFKLVPGGEQLTEALVDLMLPLGSGDPTTPEGPILIGTRQHALWRLDERGLRPLPTAIDAELRRALVYCGSRLPNGDVAIGSANYGLYVFDSDGGLRLHLDKAAGLPANAVFAANTDNQGGLWLALGNGMARVQVSAPLTRFDDYAGLEGNVFALHRHRGDLYVAAHGLFRLKAGARPALLPIAGVQSQTWDMLSVAEDLLVANNSGVYRVRDDDAQLVAGWNAGVLSLHQSRREPNRVWVGLKDGLASMRFEQGVWRDEGRVAGLSDEIRTMHEQVDGRLWLGTNVSGVLRLDLRNISAPTIEHFGTAEGLPGLIKNWVYPVREELLFATADGVYRFDEHTRSFRPDERLAQLFGEERRRVGNLRAGANGDIWMSTLNEADAVEEFGIARAQPDGRYRWDARALRAITGTGMDAMHRIMADADGVWWLGGVEALFRFDPTLAQDFALDFPAKVRKVSADGQVLFAGAGSPPPVILPYANNRLRFEFAAASFDGLAQNRFQVWLEGNDTDWSDWSSEAYRDYDNLHEGEYRLKVRARNLYGTISAPAEFAFRIRPPWFRTLWAYLGYALVALVLLYTLVRWRERRLRALQAQLQQLVSDRTAALASANELLTRSHERLINTQQQLIEQEKMAALGTLTAGVAHEINNPTNFADGAVQTLHLEHQRLHAFLRELAGDDAAPEVLAAIATRFRTLDDMTATAREGHERIKRIVRDLRQFSRLDEAERKSVPIADPIQSTVNLVRTRYDRIRFDLVLGANPAIECQPAKLGQVFMNLVVNACQAIGECADQRAGVVRIETRLHDDVVEIVVADNGIGMDDLTRRRVFEPFFTTKDVGAGTGLGLAIVFGIIKDHGGRIEVSSSPGQGSRFTITLPLLARVANPGDRSAD